MYTYGQNLMDALNILVLDSSTIERSLEERFSKVYPPFDPNIHHPAGGEQTRDALLSEENPESGDNQDPFPTIALSQINNMIKDAPTSNPVGGENDDDRLPYHRASINDEERMIGFCSSYAYTRCANQGSTEPSSHSSEEDGRCILPDGPIGCENGNFNSQPEKNGKPVLFKRRSARIAARGSSPNYKS